MVTSMQSRPALGAESRGDSVLVLPSWSRVRENRLVAAFRVVGWAVLALVAGSSGVGASDPQPPNILLVIADDVGVDSVGVYSAGPASPLTPNIDALARRGVRFDKVWSNPVCSSTRATILTGRYGFRTGMGWTASPGFSLRDREYTLPEMLARHPSHRYGMAAFGKWHLHGNEAWERDRSLLAGPVRAGFPYFSGVFHYINADYERWRELEVMDLGAGSVLTNHDHFNTRYNTSEIVDDAAAWIRAREQSHRRSPWFLWLAFNAAHSPYHKPPADLHSVDLSSPSIDCQNPFPFKTPERIVPCYRAMVEAMDHELGRLLNHELSAETLARTTVIFVGDNGTIKEAMAGDRDPLHAKGTPYQGGIHVPLIVAGPGVASSPEAGRESSVLVNTTDLFATILELAGMDAAETVPATFRGPHSDPVKAAAGPSHASAEAVVLDSFSFASVLRGESAEAKRDFVYAELFNDYEGDPIWPHARAIGLANGYKLIRFDAQYGIGAHDELYSLSDDPLERRNLLAAELGPAEEAIHGELVKRLEGVEATGWRPHGPTPDAAAATR